MWRAFEACYGYDYQGDNVLIARINLLLTFIEYHFERWQKPPGKKTVRTIAHKIAWNIWQADGLTDLTPAGKPQEEPLQFSFFETVNEAEEEKTGRRPVPCIVYDWRKKSRHMLKEIKENKKMAKKLFDYVIGNPPYQEDANENNKSYPRPLYDKFMDEAYRVAKKVELITPARFLFNAGGTKKDWNKKMLSDTHLKVLEYSAECSKYFDNVDIKGGIAITYRDDNKNFGAIKTFTPYNELNAILHRITNDNFISLSEKASAPLEYRFTDLLYKDFNEVIQKLKSEGSTPNGLKTFSFDRMPEIFHENKPKDSNIYIRFA